MALTERTSIKRVIQGQADFNLFLNRYDLVVPKTDLADLQDIQLQIYGQTSISNLISSTGMMSVRDLRVEVNGVDVTPAVIFRLREGLRVIEAGRLLAVYSQAALARLDHLSAMGVTYPEIAQDRRRLRSVTQDELVVAMGSIGDRAFGWSGQLHPFNYLYHAIDVPAVSLSDALNRVLGAPNSLAAQIRERGGLVVSFIQDAASRPAGRAVFSTELHYLNPLAELLERAMQEVSLTRQAIDKQRADLLIPTRDEVNFLKADQSAGFQATLLTLEQIKAGLS